VTVHRYEGKLSVGEYDGNYYAIASDSGSSAAPTDALDEYEGKRIRVTMMIQDLDAATAPDFDEVSDGYHTFGEMYEFRKLYNAALFNAWHREAAEAGTHGFRVHKSLRHHDGKAPFGDPNWFIVMATLPTGQISNHYHVDDFDLFDVPCREVAQEWDGHTAADVADRLNRFLRGDF
jgi:hypothetical protein